MPPYLSALGFVVGIVSGVLSIYEFSKSRQRPGAVFALIAIGLLLGAFIIGNVSSLSTGNRSDVNPVATSGNAPLGTQSTPTPSPTPSPTPIPPTPTPKPKSGDTLYQADQSWSGWNGTADWKVSDGMLLNDGTYADYNAKTTIIAPYQSDNIADYTVEIKMQVIKPFTTGTIYPCFYIMVRGTTLSNGWRGYAASVCANLGHGPAAQILAIDSSNNMSTVLSTAPFDPQNAWHSYRVEVKGTSIKFFVDGGSLLSADDSQFLNAGQVGLLSEYMEVKISDFKMTVL